MQTILPKSPSTASLTASIKPEPLTEGMQPVEGSATVSAQATAAGAVASVPVGDNIGSLQVGNGPEPMEAETAPRPQIQAAEAQPQLSAAQQDETVKAEEQAQKSESDKKPDVQLPMSDLERSAWRCLHPPCCCMRCELRV